MNVLNHLLYLQLCAASQTKGFCCQKGPFTLVFMEPILGMSPNSILSLPCGPGCLRFMSGLIQPRSLQNRHSWVSRYLAAASQLGALFFMRSPDS
jgi:hypothetical protein